MSNHYETLGVSKSATPEEIKRAYRKLASQHHPDKGGDTAKFQQVEEAYRVLSDPAQRQQYDNPQPQGGFNFNFNNSGVPPEMQDIFRNFGFNFNAGSPFRQQRKNKDMQVELSVTLESTLHEQTKYVSVMTTTGHRETVEVKIPRGVHHGSTIKYPELGDNLFNTIPRGDLFVQVAVQNHNTFSVNGIDLYTKFSVNCFTAVVGGTAEIKTLDDKILSLVIPAGTQPGTKFRISNEGLYHINSTQRGNLYAELSITIPTNLSEEQLEIVRSLANQK